MSIVSRVTIIRGKGARAAGMRRDHESCRGIGQHDVRRLRTTVVTDDAGKGGIAAGPGTTMTGHQGGAGGDMVQLITPAGERVSHPEYDPWVREVSDEQLCSLYEDMVVIRRIDAEATALQRQGELGLWPPLLGQEASQIGSARALREDDFVFPSYRENGVAYCRGVRPEGHRAGLARQRLRPAGTRTRSTWPPRRSSSARRRCTPPAMPWASRTTAPTPSAVAYFGDGATSEGDVNEAMVFAASFQVPVVFFCQNNHWAISEPVRAAVPHPAGGPRRRASASPACGWTATMSSPSWRPRASPWTAPAAAAAPPSSRPSPTGWARTRRRMTPPATGTPTNSRTGPPRTRSAGSKSLLERKGLLTAELEAAVAGEGGRRGQGAAGRHASTCPTRAAGRLQARVQHPQLLAGPPAGPLLPLPGLLRRSRRGRTEEGAR